MQSLWGEIVETRLDVPALGLTPLRLAPMGTWDPAEEYWGGDGDPIEAWARAIIARGPRPEFEMEQVLPGTEPDDTKPLKTRLSEYLRLVRTGETVLITDREKIIAELRPARRQPASDLSPEEHRRQAVEALGR
jgi:antitoxin (DNA-binding transcriptional repressor) of toxin-antitoxin stability system